MNITGFTEKRRTERIGSVIMQRKRIAEIMCLVSFLAIFMITNINNQEQTENIKKAYRIDATDTVEKYRYLSSSDYRDEIEEIRNEILYGELEEATMAVQAEAGNQDYLGKAYVADVIFNRVDDPDFPDNIHDVIYQKNPVQFAITVDGAIDRAGYTVDEETFQIVLTEYFNRSEEEIVYFRTGHYSECGTPAFKHGDHYFSTK